MMKHWVRDSDLCCSSWRVLLPLVLWDVDDEPDRHGHKVGKSVDDENSNRFDWRVIEVVYRLAVLLWPLMSSSTFRLIDRGVVEAGRECWWNVNFEADDLRDCAQVENSSWSFAEESVDHHVGNLLGSIIPRSLSNLISKLCQVWDCCGGLSDGIHALLRCCGGFSDGIHTLVWCCGGSECCEE